MEELLSTCRDFTIVCSDGVELPGWWYPFIIGSAYFRKLRTFNLENPPKRTQIDAPSELVEPILRLLTDTSGNIMTELSYEQLRLIDHLDMMDPPIQFELQPANIFQLARNIFEDPLETNGVSNIFIEILEQHEFRVLLSEQHRDGFLFFSLDWLPEDYKLPGRIRGHYIAIISQFLEEEEKHNWLENISVLLYGLLPLSNYEKRYLTSSLSIVSLFTLSLIRDRLARYNNPEIDDLYNSLMQKFIESGKSPVTNLLSGLHRLQIKTSFCPTLIATLRKFLRFIEIFPGEYYSETDDQTVALLRNDGKLVVNSNYGQFYIKGDLIGVIFSEESMTYIERDILIKKRDLVLLPKMMDAAKFLLGLSFYLKGELLDEVAPIIPHIMEQIGWRLTNLLRSETTYQQARYALMYTRTIEDWEPLFAFMQLPPDVIEIIRGLHPICIDGVRCYGKDSEHYRTYRHPCNYTAEAHMHFLDREHRILYTQDCEDNYSGYSKDARFADSVDISIVRQLAPIDIYKKSNSWIREVQKFLTTTDKSAYFATLDEYQAGALKARLEDVKSR